MIALSRESAVSGTPTKKTEPKPSNIRRRVMYCSGHRINMDTHMLTAYILAEGHMPSGSKIPRVVYDPPDKY